MIRVLLSVALIGAMAAPTLAQPGGGAELLGYLAAAGAMPSEAAAPGGAAPQEWTAEACLACHGPFETLRDRTQNWVSKVGVPVNPHLTFNRAVPASPHVSGIGIVECTTCHVPHPLDTDFAGEPADIEWCVACHHTATFRPCSECH